MSMVARRAARAVPRARPYSVLGNPKASEFMAKRAAVEEHAGHTSIMWRRISNYVCIPAIITVAIWTWQVEAEHKAHKAHLKEENGGELPETPAYDYLNKRGKPFPWGMNSLFFNSEVNKDLTDAA